MLYPGSRLVKKAGGGLKGAAVIGGATFLLSKYVVWPYVIWPLINRYGPVRY
jgi:hypothetical protein